MNHGKNNPYAQEFSLCKGLVLFPRAPWYRFQVFVYSFGPSSNKNELIELHMLRNIFPFTHLVVSLRAGYRKAVGTKLQADCQCFSTLQFCKALLANNIPV